jgi:hypothetical protein
MIERVSALDKEAVNHRERIENKICSRFGPPCVSEPPLNKMSPIDPHERS